MTKAPEPPSRRPLRAEAATANRNNNTVARDSRIPRSEDAGTAWLRQSQCTAPDASGSPAETRRQYGFRQGLQLAACVPGV